MPWQLQAPACETCGHGRSMHRRGWCKRCKEISVMFHQYAATESVAEAGTKEVEG